LHTHSMKGSEMKKATMESSVTGKSEVARSEAKPVAPRMVLLENFGRVLRKVGIGHEAGVCQIRS
jgi:hypothetical protein